jgi:hypothetical protein
MSVLTQGFGGRQMLFILTAENRAFSASDLAETYRACARSSEGAQ